jgi:hypothetical protein
VIGADLVGPGEINDRRPSHFPHPVVAARAEGKAARRRLNAA